jgi:tetratricopeptide (TPR) repeat protein
LAIAMKTLAFAILASCASIVPAFSQDNDCDTLENCQAAIKANPKSSLAHYQTGEIFFQLQNASECNIEHPFPCKEYQLAVNEFRKALLGDLNPRWIEVWSHINLGKIFDVASQRDRALAEYRLASRTKDNTRGAQNEAAKYIESPYKRQSN